MPRRALWNQVGSQIGCAIFAHLNPLTNRQLRKVAAGVAMRTSTNCWWLTHDMAPILAQCARNILHTREFNRKHAKKKGPR